MMNRLAVIFLTLCLTLSQVQASVAGKLVDFLVNDSGVAELLAKNGIHGAAADRVKSYVNLSLRSLNIKDEVPTKAQLAKILKDMPVTDQDIKIRNELAMLLTKGDDQLTKEDVVTAINNLIYLANRHGHRGSTVLACSECVSDSLHRSGFRFTLESLENTSAQKALQTIVPRDPKNLNTFIANRMRSMNIGDYSKVTRDLVGPEEERSLGLFLALSEAGSAKQKDFVQAVLEVSTERSGKVNLLNPENPHKLWKLFADDMSDDVMEGWTKLLRDVAKDSEGQTSKKEAFYAQLKLKAGDDPVLNEQLNLLRLKKCFFK